MCHPAQPVIASAKRHGKQNKHADGAQLPMALRRPLFGGFRHPGHVLIDVVVKQRDQRFDVGTSSAKLIVRSLSSSWADSGASFASSPGDVGRQTPARDRRFEPARSPRSWSSCRAIDRGVTVWIAAASAVHLG